MPNQLPKMAQEQNIGNKSAYHHICEVSNGRAMHA